VTFKLFWQVLCNVIYMIDSSHFGCGSIQVI